MQTLARGFELHPNGDSALDIRFSDAPGAELSESIIALAQAIEAASIPGVIELVPAYQCLTVCFDPLQLPTGDPTLDGFSQTLTQLIRAHLAAPSPVIGRRYRVRIPVCYAPEFAMDMQTVCDHSGLTAEQIIECHTATEYLVHMLGFTPGFLYLGGLDEQLHCPRKDRPALNVPAGSVGIGGSQTGIYPQQTPGGWQIIGRTPLQLFRPGQRSAFIAQPLDHIQFVAISPQEFAQIDPESEPQKMPLDGEPLDGNNEIDRRNGGNKKNGETDQ